MDRAQAAREKGNLLVVDDDLTARQTMETFLTREGYDVRLAPNGEMALMIATEDPPELILLDIRLPDIDGIEVCQHLKEDQKTRNIPVIFISGLGDVVDKVKGFAVGGVDYITKPFQAEEMLARVETHLTLKRLQKKVEAQNAQLEQEIIRCNRAEERVRQAAQEWRTTFDSINDLVSLQDKDFNILRANRAFADAFGMDIRTVPGKKCFEIVHGTKESWPTCPHRQTLESGQSVTEEFFEPRLGKYLQVTASPILNHENHFIGSVHLARDISRRKQVEEALQRAHDELEERVKERTADLAVANEQLRASAKALEERLEFESLLAEISGRFINLSVDRVEGEINDAQRRICETLDFDRSTIWLVPGEDEKGMFLAGIYPPQESPPLPERLDAGDLQSMQLF